MIQGQVISSAAFLLFAFVVQFASAASPEPMPPYARTEAFRADASLHAIAFYDEALGIAAGDHGAVIRTDNAGRSWTIQPSPVSCRLNEITWVNENRVVAVGGAYDRITKLSRGVVIFSDDGGRRWRRAADQELPKLTSITRREDRVLVASGDWSDASLTNQFESRDGGATWHPADPVGTGDRSIAELTAANQRDWVNATGHHVAIRAVDQVGSNDVWAAADHGVILHSKDGGKSWINSRGDQRQTAVLMIASSPSQIAWSVLGKESIEMRNRVSTLVLKSTDLPDEDRSLETSRQVVAMLGAAGSDCVNLRNFGSPDDSDLREVVDWIGVHQPAVIVLDETISETVRSHIIQASVSMKVERVVEYSFSNSATQRGDTMLHHAAMLAGSGILAGDLHADAFHWIAPFEKPPIATMLRRRYDSKGAGRKGESVTASLSLTPHQMKTVDNPVASRRQLQIVQARMSESKRVEEILSRPMTANDFVATLRSLLDQTATEDRFRLIWNALRESIQRSDQGLQSITLHAAILDEAVNRLGDTSAAQWAALRRDAIANSSEWNRLRDSLRHANPIRTHVMTAAADVVPVSPFQIASAIDDESRVSQASNVVPLLVADRTPMNSSSASAASPGPVREIDLSWEFHPSVLIAREAARQRGDDDQLQPTAGGSANLSRLAAYRSQWTHLLGQRDPSVILANHASSPPRLDGVADDSCWVSNAEIETTQTRIAYDEQYVYVLIRRPADQLRGDPLATRSAPKVRDQNLSGADRVQLRIDTDTDLLTSMQFQFTDAGRTHDSVDGFTAWQPTWYVASKRTDEHVTLELAILRRDLTDLPIHPGESWFVSTRAIPAAIDPPSTPIPVPRDWVRVVFR